MSSRLTTKESWSGAYRGIKLPRILNMFHPLDAQMIEQMNNYIAIHPLQGNAFVEIGCGASAVLPYIYHAWGAEVAGMDYNDYATRLAIKNCDLLNVPTDIRTADLFEPPDDWLNRFDIVFSSGLIEHFSNPAVPLRAKTKLLSQGGVVVAVVPNLVGLGGLWGKSVNRKRFKEHNPISCREMEYYLKQAGLREVVALPIGSFGFSMQPSQSFGKITHTILRFLLRIINGGSTAIFKFFHLSLNSPVFSRAIIGMGHV